jgi:hypothetical protein
MTTESKPAKGTECGYGDFISKTAFISRDSGLEHEFTSWTPNLVKFLIGRGMINRLPEEGELVRITLRKCGSKGQE